MTFGICSKCGKWGEAPKEFRENKHFLKCECGSPMYLTRGNPKDYAYRDQDRVNVSTMPQK